MPPPLPLVPPGLVYKVLCTRRTCLLCKFYVHRYVCLEYIRAIIFYILKLFLTSSTIKPDENYLWMVEKRPNLIGLIK